MGFLNIFGGKKEQSDKASAKAKGRFEVMGVYNITGVGTVAVGRVLEGTLYPGQRGFVNGKSMEIVSIEENHKRLKEAFQGQNIGINLSGAKRDDLQKGITIDFG